MCPEIILVRVPVVYQGYIHGITKRHHIRSDAYDRALNFHQFSGIPVRGRANQTCHISDGVLVTAAKRR